MENMESSGRVALSLISGEPSVPTHDERVAMVLEVVGGRKLEVVARGHSVLPRTLERWVEQYHGAGARALAAQEIADPSTADHLLAIVAHEIRSPLTAAVIALRLLSKEGLDEPRKAEIAQTVTSRLEMLGVLADDVLDGASVALGRMGLALQPVNLQELVESCADDVDSDRLRIESGPAATVIGDPGRLRQLVSNVLRNALRHGTDDVVTVQLARHDEYVVVSTTNHAHEPVSAEEVGAWFEPFARASSRTGHGLGLYVVRALTVAHAGTVGVDSLGCEECESGQDLRVWVRLPISGPPQRHEGTKTRASIPTQTDSCHPDGAWRGPTP